MLLAGGCGGNKKRTRVPVPPPPVADSRPAPSTPPAAPTGTTAPSATIDADLEQYANLKPIMVERGIASWYGPPYHNRKAANGEVFNMHAMTAAHKTLPLNSIVRVTNEKTGRSAMLRITDRGPFVGARVIDLSLAAAKAVDVWRPGLAEVRIDVLHTPKPIDDGGRWCVQIGAFKAPDEATELKDRLARRYRTARVLQFSGPTGEWLRVRVLDDDKKRAYEVARDTRTDLAEVFVVRLD